MSKQVQKTHYDFGRYSYPGRFASYHYQVKEVLAQKPESVLEVGVGDQVFGHYVRDHVGVAYTSVDIAEDLQPDVVGSVTALPCKDATYDVVCCFEVLEHIPYEQVPSAVRELTRVAKKAVVISVPHFGPRTQFFLKLPFLPEMRCALKIPWPRSHKFNGEHYWELGKKGYTAKAFRELLARYGTVTRDFVPFENQYHHFYTLTKSSAEKEK
ncbi:MAG: methyltransferase domain-containing protein [Candidatus Pacebacteria bacterium]|nr:methyltransferase domain-containing protein [Candidatus Paceibacterota bacterium]